MCLLLRGCMDLHECVCFVRSLGALLWGLWVDLGCMRIKGFMAGVESLGL